METESPELSTVFLSVGTYVTTDCTPVRPALGLAAKNVRQSRGLKGGMR